MEDQEWAHIANKYNLSGDQWELFKRLMNGRPVTVTSNVPDNTPGVFTINPRRAYGLALYEIRRQRLTRPLYTFALSADQVANWVACLALANSV